MSEKSGIEMLEYIQESIDLLNKRYEVIEQTMKEVLNRIGNVSNLQPPTKSVGKPTISGTMETPYVPAEPTKPNSNSSTKVMGKIKHENRAVIGVAVVVKNTQGQVVKETKTNRAGDWMCFLPPGKYQATYSLKDIINAEVGFQVTPGQTLLRVAQPQKK